MGLTESLTRAATQ